MNELSVDQRPVKRRRYSAQFKRQVVDACLEKEVSVPKVALAHGLNANMVHRWIRQARDPERAPGSEFVPVPISGVTPELSPPPGAGTESIRMEIPYHHQCIRLHWPVSQMDRCVALLRELLP